MIAFDKDILTEILVGAPEFVTRASNIHRHEQAVPVVVIEEIIRGRLQVFGKPKPHSPCHLARPALFSRPYGMSSGSLSWRNTSQADMHYRRWRQQRWILTNDLRIAAIRVTHAARLISRNTTLAYLRAVRHTRTRRRGGSQSSQLVYVQRAGLPLRLFLFRTPGGCYQLRLGVLQCRSHRNSSRRSSRYSRRCSTT